MRLKESEIDKGLVRVGCVPDMWCIKRVNPRGQTLHDPCKYGSSRVLGKSS